MGGNKGKQTLADFVYGQRKLKFQDPLMTDDLIFSKNALIQSSHMLYRSSLEHKGFVKLKKTQLFYLAIKLTKPFAVPKVCTRSKTKRGIGIILFRADNYTDIMENFQ